MKNTELVLTVSLVLLLVVGVATGIVVANPEKSCPVGDIRPLKYIGWESDSDAMIPRIPCGYEGVT